MTSWILLAPSLFGIGIFLILPIVLVGWLSLHSWNLLGPMEFVGLRNWRSVLSDDAFGHSLLVTAALTVLAVPLQTVLGFAVAALLVRRRAGGAFRVLFALPWMCAPVAVGVIWRWLFAPTDGALNALLGRRIEWLTDPALALPSVAAVSIWSNFGYVALFFVAGLRAIPPEIHEAGALDGATGWRRIRWLTLPLLRHSVLRPGNRDHHRVPDLRHRVCPDQGRSGRSHECGGDADFSEAFDAARPGRAAVMAIVVFGIMLAITVLQHRYFRTRTGYEF